MLQKLNQKSIATTRRMEEASMHCTSNVSKKNHFFSIDFEGKKTLRPPAYKHKTIDNCNRAQNSANLSWRSSYSKRLNKMGRSTAPLKSEGLVGAHCTTIEMNESPGNEIISQSDKARYQYLLKAISAIKRGKQLREIKYRFNASNEGPLSPNNEEKKDNRPIRYRKSQDMAKSMVYNELSTQLGDNAAISPKVVNISAEIEARNELSNEPRGNTFQKMFQNKRRLQGKFSPSAKDAEEVEVNILGEDELRINKVAWGIRVVKHKRCP